MSEEERPAILSDMTANRDYDLALRLVEQAGGASRARLLDLALAGLAYRRAKATGAVPV
jgi:hypothetical protein